jgi:hypothetical protein
MKRIFVLRNCKCSSSNEEMRVGEMLSSSTVKMVLFVKNNFIPGPSNRSSYWNNKIDEKNKSSNINYSYILSLPIKDQYENNDLFMFGTNHTMFLSSPFDYPFSNSSQSLSSSSSPMFISIFLGIILFTITIWTILGNILVILLLGIAVLPFSASYSTFGIWYFGKFLCEFWLAIDVLCSTASIWVS